MERDQKNILELEHISKTFTGVKALDDVQLKVRKGSVHALMGENGAGKSTMMKILIGMYQPDEGGQIWFNGKNYAVSNTRQALDSGISMIHQELMPIPEMTVADNIFMRRYADKAKIFVDYKKLYRDTDDLLKSLEISDISPRAKMKDLSTAQKQMVEIAKAVSYNSMLIIMDEPTSSISDSEVEKLFKIIRSLKAQGIAIIYISHKMAEIFQIADDITVLRDGKYIDTKAAAELTNEDLIRMMVGRELKDLYSKKEIKAGDVILEVKNLSGERFEDVSFEVRRGEILGIAGLVGAGRTEVVETIFGIRKALGGTILKDGKEITIKSSKDAIRNRIALATEDRKGLGLFLGYTITYNISVSWLDHMSRFGFVKHDKEKKEANEYSNRLRVKARSNHVKVGELSGGNQQKVVLAKWLLTEPDVLILDEPTRGIDIGAKAEIYRIMEELAAQGKAVIMISSEMPEILGMSDRIIIMNAGKVAGELTAKEATQEKVGEYMSQK